VLVGPHTEHAADVVERLVAGGGALRVSSAESLAWALAGLLDAPERAADMGRRARALVESGQGAVERHLKIITARLTQTPPRSPSARGRDAPPASARSAPRSSRPRSRMARSRRSATGSTTRAGSP
jgi:3-deoxy-D-manno-octulosonic-acid transferase